MQPAATINLSQLQTLEINKKVNETAFISWGKDKPKSVPVKSTQKMMVKQDCILEDETGSTVTFTSEMSTTLKEEDKKTAVIAGTSVTGDPRKRSKHQEL